MNLLISAGVGALLAVGLTVGGVSALTNTSGSTSTDPTQIAQYADN